MINHYNPIVQLSFQHPLAYCMEGITLKPDFAANRDMSRYRLLFKQTGNDFYLLQTCTEDDQPLVKIDKEMVFRFLIFYDYVALVHRSELPLYNPSEFCCYFRISEESGKTIPFSEQNLIPVIKHVEKPTVLINSANNEELRSNQLSDTVFYMLNEPEKYFANISIANSQCSGFVDVRVRPGQKPQNVTIEIEERKTHIRYKVFDRLNNFSSFRIESKNSLASFLAEKISENTYELTSTEAYSYTDIAEKGLILNGLRNNGRLVTIKEKLSIPNIQNLEEEKETKKYFLTAFIYV